MGTLFQEGNLRAYRQAQSGDIDIDQLLVELQNSSLPDTVLNGQWNSFRASDGDGTPLVRRVVRGDGVNTLLADAGAVSTTLNIVGMVVATDGNDVRYATAGSIVSGFAGSLTKHSIYYLGSNGQIQLTPGTVPVIVGIALTTDDFLFNPCCCVCFGSLELQYCFSSNFFLCDPDGAEYCLLDGGGGECIPALCFEQDNDEAWYCGFETPPDMDVGQASELRLRLVGNGAPSVASQFALNVRSSSPGANIFTAGSVFSTTVNPVPGAQNVLVQNNIAIPASTMVAQQQNRMRLTRQGTIDTYNGAVYLVGVTLLYPCR